MPQSNNGPLKRHPALQPFSRDHYIGLVHAQYLLRAADGSEADRRRAVAEFRDAWKEIAAHFDDEERLLPRLLTPQDRQRFESEHQQLRAKAEEARDRRKEVNPDATWLRGFGQLLNDHIRWEERELFTAIQDAVDEAALAQLAVETKQIEASRGRNACASA